VNRNLCMGWPASQTFMYDSPAAAILLYMLEKKSYALFAIFYALSTNCCELNPLGELVDDWD